MLSRQWRRHNARRESNDVRRCRERKGCGVNAHAAAIEAFINETIRCFNGAPPVSIILRRQLQETKMAFEQKDNTGALFRNDRKEGENHPDYNGSITVDGVEHWLNGWLKTSQAGKKSLSLD